MISPPPKKGVFMSEEIIEELVLDPTDDIVAAIASVIRTVTPKATIRGKKDRNRMVKRVIHECAGLRHTTKGVQP
jgi:hypothetical protein